jgi:hypothetical protein
MNGHRCFFFSSSIFVSLTTGKTFFSNPSLNVFLPRLQDDDDNDDDDDDDGENEEEEEFQDEEIYPEYYQESVTKTTRLSEGEDGSWFENRMPLIALACCCLFCLIIAIVLGLVLAPKIKGDDGKNDSSATLNPIPPPTGKLYFEKMPRLLFLPDN